MTTNNTKPIGRRFVRGVGDAPHHDPKSDDTFFMGIVCAELAAHHDEIDCAACGSKEICRTPMRKPDMFGTVTSEATGHLYGYALCEACVADRAAATEKVNLAFTAATADA